MRSLVHKSTVVVALMALLAAGCSSDDTGTTRDATDAGIEAGTAGTSGRSGTGGSRNGAGGTARGGASSMNTGGAAVAADASTGVTCGGTACTLPIGGGIERLKACCTDAGGCGLKLPNVARCLPRDMPGVRGGTQCPVPTFKTPGGDALSSCCGENGCGALDPFLGCIPNPEIGEPAKACLYDPTNDCTALTGITCDGAEDCADGKRCCGKLQGGTSYVEFGCFDSCAELVDGGSPFRWLELCHAGDTCEGAGFNCLASTVLPAPIARCDATPGTPPSDTASKSANRVNCGTAECAVGEQCCVRSPHEPYCAKAGEACECHPGTSVRADAGGLSRDASADAARVSRDANPD